MKFYTHKNPEKGLHMPNTSQNAQHGYPVQPVPTDKRVSQVFPSSSIHEVSTHQTKKTENVYENPAFEENNFELEQSKNYQNNNYEI